MLRVGLSGVGEGCCGGFELVQVPDAFLVGNGDEEDSSPLLGTPDFLQVHAGRCLREHLQVRKDLLRPGQFTGGTHDAAQDVRRRRNAVGFGNVRDPRADELRVGGEAGDGFD